MPAYIWNDVCVQSLRDQVAPFMQLYFMASSSKRRPTLMDHTNDGIAIPMHNHWMNEAYPASNEHLDHIVDPSSLCNTARAHSFTKSSM